MNQEQPLALSEEKNAIRLLPSGRSVVVSSEGGTEAIEIRSPGGEMEVRIALTEQGPVLQLKGAKLQIDSTDTVAVNCHDFHINAAGAIKMRSAQDIEVLGLAELKMKSAGSTWIDADFVNLNCQDRTGYHDDKAASEPPRLPEPPADECECM